MAALDAPRIRGGADIRRRGQFPVACGDHGSSHEQDPTRTVDLDADPWRVPIAVAQIPETGLHRDIEADASERKRGR